MKLFLSLLSRLLSIWPARQIGLIVGSVALTCSSNAYAGLLGSSVISQYYSYGGTYNIEGSPATFIANGSVQQTFCSSGCPEGFNLAVSNTQIDYTLFGSGGYWGTTPISLNSGGLYIVNGNLLTFSGATISSVTLDSASNVPGFISSDVTFNAGNIAVNWAGMSGIASGDQIILDVKTATPTPEPANCLLILTGLASIAVGCFRSRRGIPYKVRR